MKFIADCMLGTLAKWLRAMGQDVAYEQFLPDRLLLRRAREEDRILLTRDTRMIQVRDIPRHLFITRDRLEEQLAEVIKAFGLEPKEEEFLTRCIECNGLLEEVKRQKVKGKIPPYVYATQKVFQQCPGCSRVYWAGTHLPRMKAKLQGLLGKGELKPQMDTDTHG